MNKELYLLGVSFRTAPAAVREALSFTETEAADLIRRAVAEIPCLEAAVVSTCNRTEFYLAAAPEADAITQWFSLLREVRPNAPALEADCFRYQSSGVGAARHLFRVASGLDSAVLGDVQILGQIKNAFAIANAAGGIGKHLNRLFDHALRVGKQARTDTRIGHGAASLGSALAGMLARRLKRNLADVKQTPPRLLVIGAGDIARDISRHLAKHDLGDLFITNRTNAKAETLALDCGGRMLPWSEMRGELYRADVIVAATSSGEPLLKQDELNALVSLRPHRAPLVVDAGLPRNVEAGSSAEVIDIDSIREHQTEVLAARRAAVPAVEAIINNELRAWDEWRAGLPIERAIKAIYVQAETMSRDYAHTFAARQGLTATEAERALLLSFKKALHPHVRLARTLPLAERLPHVERGAQLLRALAA